MQSILVRPYILDSLTRYEDERIAREEQEKQRFLAGKEGLFQTAISGGAKGKKANDKEMMNTSSEEEDYSEEKSESGIFNEENDDDSMNSNESSDSENE